MKQIPKASSDDLVMGWNVDYKFLIELKFSIEKNLPNEMVTLESLDETLRQLKIQGYVEF